jgi:ribonuclease BN (tRNA processing enzyme)
MQVMFIGTGDAFGAGGRRQAAILMRTAGGTALLDCGATTTTGLAALGIRRDEIDLILVSHFHADHFGGIPLLLLAAVHEDDRRRPLRIAGPGGIEARVMTAAAALGHSFEGRAWPFSLTFHELKDRQEAPLGAFTVRPFAVHHAPESLPHGYRIDAGDRRIVYTGDTGWFEGLPDAARDADLLICECTQRDRGFDLHLSLEELTAERARFSCRRMLLTHLGPEMTDLRGACPFATADDGQVIQLDDDGPP